MHRTRVGSQIEIKEGNINDDNEKAMLSFEVVGTCSTSSVPFDGARTGEVNAPKVFNDR
jgi:hypothetical protein